MKSLLKKDFSLEVIVGLLDGEGGTLQAIGL
jgi:hypothetical protein